MIIKNITSLTGLQIPWSSWTSENPSRVWGVLQGASGPAHSVKELLRNAAYIAHGTGSMDKAPEGNRIRSALCALLEDELTRRQSLESDRLLRHRGQRYAQSWVA